MPARIDPNQGLRSGSHRSCARCRTAGGRLSLQCARVHIRMCRQLGWEHKTGGIKMTSFRRLVMGIVEMMAVLAIFSAPLSEESTVRRPARFFGELLPT